MVLCPDLTAASDPTKCGKK